MADWTSVEGRLASFPFAKWWCWNRRGSSVYLERCINRTKNDFMVHPVGTWNVPDIRKTVEGSKDLSCSQTELGVFFELKMWVFREACTLERKRLSFGSKRASPTNQADTRSDQPFLSPSLISSTASIWKEYADHTFEEELGEELL